MARRKMRREPLILLALIAACSSGVHARPGLMPAQTLYAPVAPAGVLDVQLDSVNDANATDEKTIMYGAADGCTAPTLPEPEPQGVLIPPLPEGDVPNFIVILTDDQGWDDISSHHPTKSGAPLVRTPNLDRFLGRATTFDNFYVTPMCSQSRAALLTGREYPKSGTMLVHGGYDYMNRGTKTAGHVMADAGYQTAHYGKWHNGRTLGYEPWHMGFQDSWFPDLYINLDNMMRHNGYYVPTKGLMEQDLMDKMMGFLREQEQGHHKPFFLYYAPNAIHQGFMRPGVGPRWQRPAPEPYLAKYRYLLASGTVSPSTVEVWAFLEYMDDVLGRLFDYIDSSPLRNNTYVLLMSDNGSELFDGERRNKLVRMPSGMLDFKRSVREGGVRNFLAVQGPGVQAGVVDSTLVHINDILPTVADLADVPSDATDEYGWDGKSFKNLLLGEEGVADGTAPARGPDRRRVAGDNPARLGWSRASPAQRERMLFHMNPGCWDPDTVPALGPNRKTLKPQPLLDYDTGGAINSLELPLLYPRPNTSVAGPAPVAPGFARCIAVSYRDYKWLGQEDKVYKFENGSHIELPCNEVTGPEGRRIAAKLSAAAREWFNDLVAAPHSFQKPTFYLGFDGWNVTNVLPDGAHERTAGRVRLLPNGATGFSQAGDSMCFAVDVDAAGSYEVVMFYTSNVNATFRLSLGNYAAVKAGTAPSITATLPALKEMAGRTLGTLELPRSGRQQSEACLVMVETEQPGTPVFNILGNIRITKLPPGTPESPATHPAAGASTAPGAAAGSSSAEQQPAPAATVVVRGPDGRTSVIAAPAAKPAPGFPGVALTAAAGTVAAGALAGGVASGTAAADLAAPAGAKAGDALLHEPVAPIAAPAKAVLTRDADGRTSIATGAPSAIAGGGDNAASAGRGFAHPAAGSTIVQGADGRTSVLVAGQAGGSPVAAASKPMGAADIVVPAAAAATSAVTPLPDAAQTAPAGQGGTVLSRDADGRTSVLSSADTAAAAALPAAALSAALPVQPAASAGAATGPAETLLVKGTDGRTSMASAPGSSASGASQQPPRGSSVTLVTPPGAFSSGGLMTLAGATAPISTGRSILISLLNMLGLSRMARAAAGAAGAAASGPAPVAPVAQGINFDDAREWVLSGAGGQPVSPQAGRGSFELMLVDAGGGLHPNLRPTPAMKQVERAAVASAARQQQRKRRESAARVGSSSGAGAQAVLGSSSTWDELRAANLWPNGQTVFESMYSPYAVEGIGRCWQCQPEV